MLQEEQSLRAKRGWRSGILAGSIKLLLTCPPPASAYSPLPMPQWPPHPTGISAEASSLRPALQSHLLLVRGGRTGSCVFIYLPGNTGLHRRVSSRYLWVYVSCLSLGVFWLSEAVPIYSVSAWLADPLPYHES